MVHLTKLETTALYKSAIPSETVIASQVRLIFYLSVKFQIIHLENSHSVTELMHLHLQVSLTLLATFANSVKDTCNGDALVQTQNRYLQDK